MTSFSSQLGTKTAPGELKPYGWTRDDRGFHDAAAQELRRRVEAEGRTFGCRREPPAKQSLLRQNSTAERVALIPVATIEKPLVRHPRFKFVRSR